MQPTNTDTIVKSKVDNYKRKCIHIFRNAGMQVGMVNKRTSIACGPVRSEPPLNRRPT